MYLETNIYYYTNAFGGAALRLLYYCEWYRSFAGFKGQVEALYRHVFGAVLCAAASLREHAQLRGWEASGLANSVQNAALQADEPAGGHRNDNKRGYDPERKCQGNPPAYGSRHCFFLADAHKEGPAAVRNFAEYRH